MINYYIKCQRLRRAVEGVVVRAHNKRYRLLKAWYLDSNSDYIAMFEGKMFLKKITFVNVIDRSNCLKQIR